MGAGAAAPVPAAPCSGASRGPELRPGTAGGGRVGCAGEAESDQVWFCATLSLTQHLRG